MAQQLQSDFDTIKEIASDDLVQLSKDFVKDWGKKLRLGHTDWLIEHDMVAGSGHDNYIPASTYFQCIRELYTRAKGVGDREASAMECQADLLDAEDELFNAGKDSEKLRAKAKIKRATNNLSGLLVSIRDTKKEMECLHKIMKRHEPQIKALYDCDIEKAQSDIWESRAAVRMMTGGDLKTIPLPPVRKAEISQAAQKGKDASFEIQRIYKKQIKAIHATKGRNSPLLSDPKR